MTRCRVRRSLAVCCVALAFVLSGCQVDWATWGFGVERQGYNPAEDTEKTTEGAEKPKKKSMGERLRGALGGRKKDDGGSKGRVDKSAKGGGKVSTPRKAGGGG